VGGGKTSVHGFIEPAYVGDLAQARCGEHLRRKPLATDHDHLADVVAAVQGGDHVGSEGRGQHRAPAAVVGQPLLGVRRPLDGYDGAPSVCIHLATVGDRFVVGSASIAICRATSRRRPSGPT